MASTLGTWSVDLIAKIEKFESDLGRAAATAERQGEKIRRSLEKSVEGVAERWKAGLFEIGAAVGIGFSVEKVLEFGKRTLEVADQMNKLSEKVGVSVEALSDLNFAAESAGVNTEALQSGLVKFSKTANDAATGSKAQVAAFQALGISQQEVNAHLGDTDGLLKIVAEKFSSYRDSATKTAVAVDLFGKSGADLIPVLNMGAKGLEESAAKARLLGLELSGDTAKAATGFLDNIQEVSQAVQGFANQAMARVIPQLRDASARFADWATHSEGLRDAVNKVADALVFVADHLEQLLAGIKVVVEIGLAKVLLGWTTATLTWAASLVVADANLKRLSVGIQGLASVLVGAFAGWQIGTYLSDQFEIVRRSAAVVLGGVLALWVKIREGAEVAFAGIKFAFFATLDAISNAWLNFQKSTLQRFASGEAGGIGNMLGLDPAKAQAELDRLNSSLQGTTNRTEAYRVQIALAHADAAKGIADIRENVSGYVALGDGTEKAAVGVQRLSTMVVDGRPNIQAFGTALDEAAKKALQLQQAELGAAQMLAGLQGQIDPSRKSFDDYVKTIIEINKVAAELKEKGESLAKVQQFLTAATEAAAAVQERQRRVELDQLDVVGRLNDKLSDELQMAGLTTQQRQVEADVLDAINTRKAKGLSLTEQEIAQIRQTSTALHAQIDQRNQLRAVIENFQSTFKSGLESVSQAFAQLITGGIHSWNDFGKQLVNIARNFVAQIIQQFLQLAVVNRIMNSLFGGSAPVMSIGSLFGASGGGIASLFGAGGGGAAGGGGGLNSGLLSALGSNPTSLFSRMFGGGGAFSGATAAGEAYSVGAGGSGAFSGSLAAGSGSAGPGAFATAAPWAGAALGAYYGWQQGGDTTGKALGAAAYGTAAYAATSAALAGSLAAIPVVGWIALAAIAVDKLSGGKLFGTKFATKSATQSIEIGSTGGSASLELYQERQGSLFSGKKRRTKTGTPSDDAIAAAESLFDSVNLTMVEAAKALGTEVIPIIGGTFDTITEFDKKGHAKATKTIVTVLGQKYEEDAAAFAARLSAESIIALIDANQGAGMATKIAQQWRSSAEDLAAGADYLLNVQIGINRGQTILAAGADATLATVDAIVEAARGRDETLAQTYQRLMAATQQYLQMVAQIDAQIAAFSAPAMSQFESALAGVYNNATNLTAQLNAAAQAAGLSAAKQSDLTKVQQLAGLQAAALTRQLEAQTAQLVAKLYPDTSADDRIAQLNAEIAAAGTQSVEQLIAGGGQLGKKVAERDALVQAKADHELFLQRIGDATQLAQNIGDIAFATGRTVDEITSKLGIDPAKLAKDLGIDVGDLTKTLQAAEQQAEALFQLQQLSGQTNQLLQKILDAIRGPGGAAPEGGTVTNSGYTKPGGPLSAAGARYAGLRAGGSSDPVMTEVRDLLRSIVANTEKGAEGSALTADEIRKLRMVDARERNALPRGLVR